MKLNFQSSVQNYPCNLIRNIIELARLKMIIFRFKVEIFNHFLMQQDNLLTSNLIKLIRSSRF